MFKIKSSTRLATTIGMGCASIVWLAVGLGVIPDPAHSEIQNRIALTKSIAVNVTTFAENKRKSDLRTILHRTVEADENVESVGVKRLGRSNYEIATDTHRQNWIADWQNDPGRQIELQINANGKPWGTVEVAFKPISEPGFYGFLIFPLGLVCFISASMTLLTWSVLSKTFKYLNPSKVVPDRVKSALDTLTEGLVLISPSGDIAHANEAFATIVHRSDEEILGSKLDEFEWVGHDDVLDYQYPWTKCQSEGLRVCGEIIQLKTPNFPVRKFVVNANPISGAGGATRGALISFDDVTAIENKNAELGKMIQTLRCSRDEVERQNEKLSFLASFDPLTKCMNRRAFFGKFEAHWEGSETGELVIMMLDVDHFKAVNDNHGHSTGDEVLKAMGSLLRDQIGTAGLVCRYGGEEFVLLLPDVEIDECMELAETIRSTIEQSEAAGIRYTASIGVSSRKFGSMDPQHMLDQADECLYIAKRHGRNQVVRFDERSNYAEAEEPADDITKEIPYSAVTGLLSALSFRCQTTAQHSIRVADLCVSVGEQLLNSRDLYRLEIAALLHDIGKIGVPDSILNKPGPLNEDEWRIMRKHDQIGVEIVRSAFGSEKIAGVIESHHYCFTLQNGSSDQTRVDESIPLAGRIITACDAFDSMTHDRIYRKAISETEALKEIASQTPERFDEEVVQRLIEHIQNNHRADSEPVEVVPQGTDAVGQYIENLYVAIEEHNVEGIRSVVDDLQRDVTVEKSDPETAESLNESTSNSEDDLEKVLTLANEVMEVCRESRTGSIEMPEVTTSKEHQAEPRNS